MYAHCKKPLLSRMRFRPPKNRRNISTLSLHLRNRYLVMKCQNYALTCRTVTLTVLRYLPVCSKLYTEITCQSRRCRLRIPQIDEHTAFDCNRLFQNRLLIVIFLRMYLVRGSYESFTSHH